MTSYVIYEESMNPSAFNSIPGFIWLLMLVFCLLLLIANWRLFSKAGIAGWKSLIPFYNNYNYFKIVYGNGWKFLLLFIPFFNVIYGLVVQFKFAKCYSNSTLMGILNIFFAPIIILVLAFGNYHYLGTYETLR